MTDPCEISVPVVSYSGMVSRVNKLRIAVFGAGYWSQFQIPAWQAVGAEVVAIYNRTYNKAVETAQKFCIKNICETPQQIFENINFDIADIITEADYHEPLVLMAAKYKKPVICQKPMSKTYESCKLMTESCVKNDVWYAVHENFRFQPPIIKLKETIMTSDLGKILNAHLQLRSPDRGLMDNQPALKMMDNMAIRDMGPHIFDVARYLFGEVDTIYARSFRSYHDIPVEDSMISMLGMENGFTVGCDLVHDFIYKAFVRLEKGNIILYKNNDIVIETEAGSSIVQAKWDKLEYIPDRDWEQHGGHVFASIPLCLEMFCESFKAGRPADTSGEDNLKTLAILFAAIESNKKNNIVNINEFIK